MLTIIEMQKAYYKILEYLYLLRLVQRRYEFKGDFDFHGWLINIKEWMGGIKEHENLEKFRERKKMLLSEHKKVTKSIDNLELDDPLLDPSICYQMALEKELNALPIISANRPNKTYAMRLVSLLIMMYKEGSGEEPSCYRNAYTSQYNGEFYHFINDILPVLKYYGITVKAKVESLARYAVELIPQRREDKPYRHKVTSIDEALLKE